LNTFRSSLCTERCKNRKTRTAERTDMLAVSLRQRKTKSAEGSNKITLEGSKYKAKP